MGVISMVFMYILLKERESFPTISKRNQKSNSNILQMYIMELNLQKYYWGTLHYKYIEKFHHCKKISVEEQPLSSN